MTGPLIFAPDGGHDFQTSAQVAAANAAQETALHSTDELVRTVKQYGAVGNGVNDDTAAIQAAVAAVTATRGILFFPAGNYLTAPAAFTDMNFCRLEGAGHLASQITFTGIGAVGWTFHNAQKSVLCNLYFSGGGAVQSGVLFDQQSGVCTIEQCQFVAFTADGLQLTGTVGSQQSGHKVADCLFLQNSGKQLHLTYSNDFWIEGNQFGITNGIPTPDYGCYIENSSAGVYTRNVHWDNNVGFYTTGSSYNRIEMNRFEESHSTGVHLANGAHIIFTGNTIHTNSKGTVGGADQAAFTGIGFLTVGHNQAFDWSGLHYADVSFAFGVGCTNLTIKGNQASDYNSTPFYLDPTLSAIDLSGDDNLRFLSGSTVAAGATAYLGPAGANAALAPAAVTLGRRFCALRLFVASDAAPGVGQSFVYTVMQNGAATTLAATITGAAFSAYSANSLLELHSTDQLVVRVVASGGAAVTVHRTDIALCEY